MVQQAAEPDDDTPEWTRKWLKLLRAITAIVVAVTALAVAASGAITPIVERMFGQDTELTTRVRTLEGIVEEQSKASSRAMQELTVTHGLLQDRSEKIRDNAREIERLQSNIKELEDDLKRHERDLIRLGVQIERR